jgi:hypothetical protein
MKHLSLSAVLVALFLVRPITAYCLVRIEPVKSSNISSIGYDAISSTLEVEFVSGAVYQCYKVPKSVYEGLMSAKSHGSYLAHYVKDAGYHYKEIQ